MSAAGCGLRHPYLVEFCASRFIKFCSRWCSFSNTVTAAAPYDVSTSPPPNLAGGEKMHTVTSSSVVPSATHAFSSSFHVMVASVHNASAQHYEPHKDELSDDVAKEVSDLIVFDPGPRRLVAPGKNRLLPRLHSKSDLRAIGERSVHPLLLMTNICTHSGVSCPS